MTKIKLKNPIKIILILLLITSVGLTYITYNKVKIFIENKKNEETPFLNMDIGSARKFTGSCLFINVFLYDEESSFDASDKESVLNIYGNVWEYFYKQLEKYNKDLSIIYDYDDLIIDYTVDFKIPIEPSESSWHLELADKIYSEYDIGNIVKKYHADNWSFLFNINKPGYAYAGYQVHNNGDKYRNEISILYTFNLDSKGNVYNQNDFVYAHEILHLFGAIDLYYDEPGREELKALSQMYFPNDIMSASSRSFTLNDLVISDFDAYLIGWDEKLETKYEIFLDEFETWFNKEYYSDETK